MRSVVAGAVLCTSLLVGGCASHRVIELDVENPAVRISTLGVLFGDEYVEPAEVAEILDDYDVPRDRVIYILLDPEVKDLRPARSLMASLSRAGYSRSVLVTKRHAESVSIGKKKPSSVAPKQSVKRVIRYKKASE